MVPWCELTSGSQSMFRVFFGKPTEEIVPDSFVALENYGRWEILLLDCEDHIFTLRATPLFQSLLPYIQWKDENREKSKFILWSCSTEQYISNKIIPLFHFPLKVLHTFSNHLHPDMWATEDTVMRCLHCPPPTVSPENKWTNLHV